MKTSLDEYKGEGLLKRLVGRCKCGKVTGLSGFLKVMVGYDLPGKKGHLLKEIRVGQ